VVDPDWADVIPLLGGQLDPAQARVLVARLLDQDLDLFNHALDTALRVLGERPDRDALLTPEHAQRITGTVRAMIGHHTTRHLVLWLLTAVPTLPQAVLDQLLALLRNYHPGVRRAAVAALAGRNAPGQTGQLLALLHDDDPFVRGAVARALAGRDAPRLGDQLDSRAGGRTSLLNTLTTTPIRASLTGHTDSVFAMARAAAGPTALTGSDDGTAIVWDLANLTRPARQATLTSHTAPVSAVALGADGRTALTGGYDRTAILWYRSRAIEVAAHVVDHACAAAGQGLSQDEWAKAVPGIPYNYKMTCP
jgi:HEAT repeats/WD domain, G-beta repeat